MGGGGGGGGMGTLQALLSKSGMLWEQNLGPVLRGDMLDLLQRIDPLHRVQMEPADDHHLQVARDHGRVAREEDGSRRAPVPVAPSSPGNSTSRL